MINGLLVLIKERFPLVQYGPMILVFVLANGLYFSGPETFSTTGILVSLVILFSAFLRLRLFDEIKDYETDHKINPTRPLARGVLTRDQVKVAILFLIVLEVILCASLGLTVFVIHALAIGYSILMFEEFFIGNILRPHLTTYAVTHTFVSVLFSLTAAFGAMANPTLPQSLSALTFFLMNWAFFNLFEFARKTFAREEERPGVDTYTSLFGITGAVGLSLSQVLLGLVLIHFTVERDISVLLVLAALYVLISLVFVMKRNIFWARIFRHSSGAYLLFQYAALVWLLGKDLL